MTRHQNRHLKHLVDGRDAGKGVSDLLIVLQESWSIQMGHGRGSLSLRLALLRYVSLDDCFNRPHTINRRLGLPPQL